MKPIDILLLPLKIVCIPFFLLMWVLVLFKHKSRALSLFKPMAKLWLGVNDADTERLLRWKYLRN